MNLAALQKRIEALEEQRGEQGRTDRWFFRGKLRRAVRQIWDGDKQVGGYTGPITEDMLVIKNILITPIAAFDVSEQKN